MIRWLAELGISIAGTQALRVRGRKSGKQRGVVINLLTVDGVDYVVSPRGNTQWARNVRAAGVVEIGPRWPAFKTRRAAITAVSDAAKPEQECDESRPGRAEQVSQAAPSCMPEDNEGRRDKKALVIQASHQG